MVDTHAITHLSDGLVPGLNYGPAGNTAEYVKASKLVKFRPEAGDRYSPGAAKVIRFRLVDDCWLNSARVQVTLNNKTLTAGENPAQLKLTPIAPPLAMFTSCRLFLGGQVVEQIDEVQTLAKIIDSLQPANRRLNDSIMANPIKTGGYEPIPAGGSRRLLFELPFGMFKQHRWLPLHILSQLVVELTLGPAPNAFAEATADWFLTDVAMLGTCLHVDSSVTSRYHEHIDRGNKLVISFQSIVASRHIVNQPEFTISLSRSLKQLKQLYFVLVANTDRATKVFKQKVSGFGQVNLTTDDMSFQVQIGSMKFPDNECVGVSESYFRLIQATGHEQDKEDMAISPTDLVGKSAIFGIVFENSGNEALFSGISTYDGKVMSLHVKTSQVTSPQPHTVFVYQVYDGVCNIRKAAVDVEE